MADKQKTDYQIAVDQIKAIVEKMSVKDVLRLRKSMTTVLRDVLKKQRTSAKRVLSELDNAIDELTPKTVESQKPKKSKK